jgi:hypothetical protein
MYILSVGINPFEPERTSEEKRRKEEKEGKRRIEEEKMDNKEKKNQTRLPCDVLGFKKSEN